MHKTVDQINIKKLQRTGPLYEIFYAVQIIAIAYRIISLIVLLDSEEPSNSKSLFHK